MLTQDLFELLVAVLGSAGSRLLISIDGGLKRLVIRRTPSFGCVQRHQIAVVVLADPDCLQNVFRLLSYASPRLTLRTGDVLDEGGVVSRGYAVDVEKIPEQIGLTILVELPVGFVLGELFKVLDVAGYFFATRFDIFIGFGLFDTSSGGCFDPLLLLFLLRFGLLGHFRY